MQNNSDHLAGGAGGGVQAAVQRLMAVFDRCGVIAGNYRSTVEAAIRAELACPEVAAVGDALTGDAVIDLVKEAGLDWHAGFNLDDENRYGTLVQLAFNLGAASRAPEVVRAEPVTQRSDKDYAIEHAEYMAIAAEQLIEKRNALYLAEYLDGETPGGAEDVVDAASEAANEALIKLRESIYEFRKRRDRAAQPKAPAPKGDAKDAVFIHWTSDAGYLELWLSKHDEMGHVYPLAGPLRCPPEFAAILASKGGAA